MPSARRSYAQALSPVLASALSLRRSRHLPPCKKTLATSIYPLRQSRESANLYVSVSRRLLLRYLRSTTASSTLSASACSRPILSARLFLSGSRTVSRASFCRDYAKYTPVPLVPQSEMALCWSLVATRPRAAPLCLFCSFFTVVF